MLVLIRFLCWLLFLLLFFSLFHCDFPNPRFSVCKNNVVAFVITRVFACSPVSRTGPKAGNDRVHTATRRNGMAYACGVSLCVRARVCVRVCACVGAACGRMDLVYFPS